MPPVNPHTSISSTNISHISTDSSNQECSDIWFDTIDHVEMEETWFDTSDEYQDVPSSSAGYAADSLVPFTEDCRRGVQQFVRTLGEYGENRMLSFCLSRLLPGTPVSLALAANSLYTAVTEKRNIDTASLHALGLASYYLNDNIDFISRLAAYIRDTVIGWTDDTFLQQFLGNEENRTSTHMFAALATTAIVAGRWMKDRGSPQRSLLKVPTFVANIFIRASHYWTALGNMAHSLPSGMEMQESIGQSRRAPAFEVDTRMEMTEDVCNSHTPCLPSTPRLTAFSSNSTTNPEAYTRATLQNRYAPATGENTQLSLPEKAHYFTVDKLRKKSGLSELLYCATSKTESNQQTNEKIITNTYFNTKCDATVYSEPFTKTADSIPIHTEIPLSSSATGRSVGDSLLPLVITGGAVMPVATSYMQAMKSKTFIAVGATATITGTCIAGRFILDKFVKDSFYHEPLHHANPENIKRSSLNTQNKNVAEFLSDEGLIKKTGKVRKEKLLYLVSYYIFHKENDELSRESNIKRLARKILSSTEIYGGLEKEKLSSKQAEYVIRNWVFKNIIRNNPDEYIEGKIKMNVSMEYSVDDIYHLLPIDKLPSNKHFHPDKLLPLEKEMLLTMWKSFLIEEIPFLMFSEHLINTMSLKSFNFANLYSGSLFLKKTGIKEFTVDEAISTGQAMWDFAVSEGISEDKLGLYLAPVILFNTINSSGGVKKEKVGVLETINRYLQYRKEVIEVQNDIKNKYNNYVVAIRSWLRKEKLADDIISKCQTLDLALPDLADIIRTKEQKREKSEKHAKQHYMNGISKPCSNAPDSLNDEYKKLTINFADSFREIDKYLILSAFLSLPKNEQKFISSLGAIINSSTLKMKADLGTWPEFGYLFYKEINVHLNRTDLFSVRLEKQERIYALTSINNDQEAYKLIRVDRDINKYIYGGLLDYDFGSEYIYDASYVKAYGHTFKYSIHTENKAIAVGNDNIKSLVDSLSNVHRETIFHAVYEAGNDKSDLQKIWSVIKHIIPFYDCVEGIVYNEPEQAVPACLMDALAFIPVFGTATSIGTKFGMGLAMGLRSGTSVVVRKGVKTASENLFRQVRLPTTKELASLGKDTLIAADPGIQMLIKSALLSRNFVKKISSILSDNSKTVALAEKIASEDFLSNFPLAISGEHFTGLLPGINLEVPVKAINSLDGKYVYVRINPDTGEKFGRRYFCRQDGYLEPLSGNALKTRGAMAENNLDDNDIIYMGNRIKRGARISVMCSRSPSQISLEQNNVLTNNERYALSSYGRSVSYDINEYMSKGMPESNYLTPELLIVRKQAVIDIKSALKKIPYHQGTVYRGAAMDKEYFENLSAGQIMTSKSFLSCSTDINVALLHKQANTNNQIPIIYEISINESGHPISQYTGKIKEKEILIENDKYFIISNKKRGMLIMNEVDGSSLTDLEKDHAMRMDIIFD